MLNHETIFGLDTTQLKFGRNSLNELGWELKKHNPTKVLLVVDPVLHGFDVTQKILDQIKLSEAEVIIYDNISVEPTLESFEASSQFALKNSFDLASIPIRLMQSILLSVKRSLWTSFCR